MRGSAGRAEGLGIAGRGFTNSFPDRCGTDRNLRNDPLGGRGTGRHFRNSSLGRLGKGRGGWSGRQDRNTDINNSVLGDKTGSVLLSSISSNTIWGSEFRSSTLALANGMGLHSLPSYSTSISSKTDNVVAGGTKCTAWAVVWRSSSISRMVKRDPHYKASWRKYKYRLSSS